MNMPFLKPIGQKYRILNLEETLIGDPGLGNKTIWQNEAQGLGKASARRGFKA